MPDDVPAGENSSLRKVITLVAVLLCLLAGWFVWHKVAQMGSTQDCVASGRRDCLQVPSSN